MSKSEIAYVTMEDGSRKPVNELKGGGGLMSEDGVAADKVIIEVFEVVDKLNAVKTMPELDALRGEAVKAMKGNGEEAFNYVQGAFRKALNRLKRIPLRDRTW